MRTRHLVVWGTALLACLMFSTGVFAAELDIRYTLLNLEGEAEIRHGTVEIQVINLTGEALRNVDLRAAQLDVRVADFGVLQLGSIAAGQIGITQGLISIPASLLESGEPLVWRVDYDVTSGNHTQGVVVGVHIAK